jgi:4-alpha-glucanotransferase
MVGTLPLLAGFLSGDPYDPSPYAAASRLAWNDLYIDIEAVPEFAAAPEVQAFLVSPEFEAAATALAGKPLVDYTQLAGLKRRALEGLAATFFAAGESARTAQFRAFLQQNPHIEDYARFRAAGEHQGRGWQAWPEPQRSGALAEADYDLAAMRYHQYVQWLASEQIAAAGAGMAGLYMDLPLGVHASSYDTWRYRDHFAQGVAAGAPPDALFINGQNWGFPPLHPRLQRELDFIAALRHHLRHAVALRVDHVMGLYRQYWVPAGFAATDGVYIRYPAEELAAIVCLESQRAQTVVVGENLGTVPESVQRLMDRHDLRPLYVAQFSPTGDPGRAFHAPAAAALASLNTHDTPTFAGWWEGRDIDDQLDLGLIDEPRAESERHTRHQTGESIEEFLITHGLSEQTADGGVSPRERVAGVLRWLAASDAWAVLVNLEDLLLEEHPQNVPGTYLERPNWQRKAAADLATITQDAWIQRLLRAIAAARRQAG